MVRGEIWFAGNEGSQRESPVGARSIQRNQGPAEARTSQEELRRSSGRANKEPKEPWQPRRSLGEAQEKLQNALRSLEKTWQVGATRIGSPAAVQPQSRHSPEAAQLQPRSGPEAAKKQPDAALTHPRRTALTQARRSPEAVQRSLDAASSRSLQVAFKQPRRSLATAHKTQPRHLAIGSGGDRYDKDGVWTFPLSAVEQAHPYTWRLEV